MMEVVNDYPQVKFQKKTIIGSEGTSKTLGGEVGISPKVPFRGKKNLYFNSKID